MRVLILSDISSVHTIKWANSLAEKNIKIMVFGLKPGDKNVYNKNIEIKSVTFSEKTVAKPMGSPGKFKYLGALPYVKKLIAQFKPDIIHAHYISSYGVLGAFTGFHPFITSVWGADIYTFPARTFFHKKLIQYVLAKSDKILSTSKVMSVQTAKYTDKKIEVTPFGIDTYKFAPFEVEPIFTKNEIVIGTIKALENQYGVEYLIRSFHLVKQLLPKQELKLLIVGKGALERELKNLTVQLGIEDDVLFTGEISFSEIPKYHNMIDIFAALSVIDDESFGVAVIEASACEKPVVVSDAGGLPEVVENNVTGFVVQRKNIKETADIFIRLIQDEGLRNKLGTAGRKRVIKLYDWNKCIEQMISIYNKIVNGKVN